MGDLTDAGASRSDVDTPADDHEKVLGMLNSEAWEKRLEEARLKRQKALAAKEATSGGRERRIGALGGRVPMAPPEFAETGSLVVPIRSEPQAAPSPAVTAMPGGAGAGKPTDIDARIDRLEAELATVRARSGGEAKAARPARNKIVFLAGGFSLGLLAGVIAMQMPAMISGRSAEMTPSAQSEGAPEVAAAQPQVTTPSTVAGPTDVAMLTPPSLPPAAPLAAIAAPRAPRAGAVPAAPTFGLAAPAKLSAVAAPSAPMPELAVPSSRAPTPVQAAMLGAVPIGPNTDAATVPAPTASAPPRLSRPTMQLAAIALPEMSLSTPSAPRRPAPAAGQLAFAQASVTIHPRGDLPFPAADERPFAIAPLTIEAASRWSPEVPTIALPSPLRPAPMAQQPPVALAALAIDPALGLAFPQAATPPVTAQPTNIGLPAGPGIAPSVDLSLPLAPVPQPTVADATVSVFVPSTVSDADVQSLTAELADSGYTLGDPVRVNFKISQTNVRYYHAEDAEAAEALADQVGAIARDFTGAGNMPPPGLIEVWMKGSGRAVSRPARTARQRAAPDPRAQAAAELKRELIRKLNQLTGN